MATLVYIHGESYEWNSGNLYDGTVLAAHSNIIVVTINFRLGVLGELSLVISHICLSISALKLEIGRLRNFSITFNSPSSSLYTEHMPASYANGKRRVRNGATIQPPLTQSENIS